MDIVAMSRANSYNFLISAIAILAISVLISDAGIIGNVKSNNNYNNRSKAGICTLEVPTIDLLSEEDKREHKIPNGNGTRPGMSKIEVCCSGWTRKPHNFYECEPICDGGCENGNCTAPNVCVCRRGFEKTVDLGCVQMCPVGCLNGVCTNSGACSCNNGYTPSKDGRYCLPRCNGGCGNGGKCIGPETCECREGFTLDKRTNKCGFHCEGGCQGGTCIGPNQCSCQPGFIKTIDNRCIPECVKGCQNGECTAPNVCTCPSGWSIDKTGSICEAHCSAPCLNADCTAPDTCTCKKGYIKDSFSMSRNKCVAHCPGGCENGQCSAPNFCICNPGFVKVSKGSNVCVRRTRRSVMHFELIPQQSE